MEKHREHMAGRAGWAAQSSGVIHGSMDTVGLCHWQVNEMQWNPFMKGH